MRHHIGFAAFAPFLFQLYARETHFCVKKPVGSWQIQQQAASIPLHKQLLNRSILNMAASLSPAIQRKALHVLLKVPTIYLFESSN